MKRTLSLALTFVMVLSFLFSLPVSTIAASDKTVSGSVSDTSREDGGTVYWTLKYNTSDGTASLNITGDGYMPNALYDQTWHNTLPDDCYLTSVTIGEGVKSIMNGAFSGESELESIVLPESLEVIGEGAFSGTGIKNITIPAKVNAVSVAMFEATAIENIFISENNPYFNSVDGVVYSEDGKTLVAFPVARFNDEKYSFSIPDTVEEIGEYAFVNCTMKSVVIPNSVKRICQYAFAGNIYLTDVTMSSSIEYIEDLAFFSCDSLMQIYLPASLKRIEYNSVGCIYELYLEDIYAVLNAGGVTYDSSDLLSLSLGLYALDYTIDQFIGCSPNSKFKIYAPAGSVGESHAARTGFKCITTPCCPVQILGGASVYNGVRLSWTKSSDGDGYIIERNTSGKWTEIYRGTSANETVYTDKTAKYLTNDYRVKAYNANGVSVASNEISVRHYKTAVPVSAKNTTYGIEFTFTEGDLAKKYYIYRKAAGESKYTRLDVVSDGLSYADTTVKNGVTYTYTVRGYDGEKFCSYDADGVTCTYVAAPKISVANSRGGVTVKWSNNKKATSYSVYRRAGSGSSVLIYTAKAGETAYKDTAVKSGTKYKYYVKANIGKTRSANYTASSQNILYLATPNAKAVNATNGVKITWSKIAGAKGYYVYRRVSGGSWSRIYTGKSASVLSFVDKTAKTGVKYEYTVRAVNGKTAGAYKNPAATVQYVSTPKLTAIKSTKSGVKINYSDVSGCDGYIVYRRVPDGSWAKLATVKGAKKVSFTDKTAKKGKTYIYTVKAYDGKAKSAHYSGLKIKDKY